MPPRSAASLVSLGPRVALRTLAMDTFLREAHRGRLTALPVSTLEETLLAALRTLAAGPHLP